MDVQRFEGLSRFLQHVLVVENLDETEGAPLHLTPQKDVGTDVEIVGKRKILIDRLDALAPRIDRMGELYALAREENLALLGMVDAGDAFDHGRLAGAVVAEETDDLAGID